MQRQRIDSTSLKSAGYEAATRTLEIEFHDGVVYRYFNVAPVVYRDLLLAPSAGRYFAFFIKTTYRCRKVAR